MTIGRRPTPRPGRRGEDTHEQVMVADGLVFDLRRRRVLLDGYVVHLPPREAALLQVLMAHPGQLVDRSTLVNAAWGTPGPPPGAVDRLLRRLRRRLQLSPISPARLRRVGDTDYIFGR